MNPLLWSPTLPTMRHPVRFDWIAAAALLIGSLAPQLTNAQDASTTSAPTSGLKPVHMRIKRFQIPFTVAETGQRPTEVQLLVSRDGGRQWAKFAAQSPTAKTFLFETVEDGEFWFATRTIDGAGNSYPDGDVQPLLFVRVDTTDPQVDLQAELASDMSVAIDLRCTDAWPNRDSVRLEQYTDVENRWVDVAGFEDAIKSSGSDALEGTLRFTPTGDWHQLSVRAIVKDLAGNQTIATHQLQRPRLAATPGQLASSPLPRADATHTPATQGTPDTQVNPYAVAAMQILNPPPTRMAVPPAALAPASPMSPGPTFAAPAPFMVSGGATNQAEGPPSMHGLATEQLLPGAPSSLLASDGSDQLQLTSPGQAPAAATPPARRATTPAQAMRPLSAEEIAQTLPQANETVARPSLEGTEVLPPTMPATTLPPLDPTSTSALIRYSSSRKFSLDYEVESTGRAGVEEVELWGTVDRGLTWKRWGADPDRQSPFDIETNNDGVYGFSIVVVGRNGLATPRPIAQSMPDIYVAVDTLKPVVRITGATYGEGDQTGSLLVRYEYQDENPSPRPISLSFSDSTQGPWTTIAAGLENRGGYVWPADPQLPRQIYLRVDATDLAGNSGSYVLDTPIDVQGLAPRARIRGFNPITATTPTAGSPSSSPPQTAATPSAIFK
ncbi:MAG: hypothetical protein ACO1RT_09125 [Planctomycetaceae bacterium]